MLTGHLEGRKVSVSVGSCEQTLWTSDRHMICCGFWPPRESQLLWCCRQLGLLSAVLLGSTHSWFHEPVTVSILFLQIFKSLCKLLTLFSLEYRRASSLAREPKLIEHCCTPTLLVIRKKSWSLSLKSLNFKDTKLRRVKSSLPTFPRIRSRERSLIQLSDLQLVFFPPRLAPWLSQKKNFLDKVKWTKKTLFKVTATEQCSLIPGLGRFPGEGKG